jgi:hypothetical protein
MQTVILEVSQPEKAIVGRAEVETAGEYLDQIAVRGRSERRLWSLAFSVKSAAIPGNHAVAEFNPEPGVC